MRPWLMALIVGAVFGVGCQNLPPPTPILPPTPAAPPVRLTQPLDGLVGRVISVNPRLNFVVLDYSLNALPTMGERLSVTRDDNPVGELKVTGPIRNSTVLADIISGDLQVGDQARPGRGNENPIP